MALDYRRERRMKNMELTENIIAQAPIYVQSFIEYLEVTRSDTTLLSYARDLVLFLEYSQKLNEDYKDKAMSEFPIEFFADLSVSDLKKYERYLLKYKQLSNATIKRKLSTLATFFKYLNIIHLLTNNPFVNYEYPKVEDHIIHYLNAEQTAIFLNGIASNEKYLAKRPTGILDSSNKMIMEQIPEMLPVDKRLKREKSVLRNFAIAMLFLGTGLRISELVGIDISDIDFKSKYVVVSRKGRKMSLKRVYFGEDVASALLDYIEGTTIPMDIVRRYPPHFLEFCSKNATSSKLNELAKKQFKRDDIEFLNDVSKVGRSLRNLGRASMNPQSGVDALFLSSRGRRMSVRMVELIVKEAVLCYLPELKNKDNISPHKLRSTCATRVLSQTGDIMLVSKLLDHSSPSVTAKFYAKLQDEKVKEKLAQLDVKDW